MPADTSTGLLISARDRGDHAAWSRLVSIYTPLLHAWACRAGVPRQDADDLVQEVLLAVAAEMTCFVYDRRKGSFRGWLRMIFANRLRHRLRSGPGPVQADEAALTALEDPNGELSQVWDADHDRHVVAALLESVRGYFQERTWQAFAATVLDGVSPADAAADLGMSVEAVYQARSRVLARLRREADGLLD
jgi:RNA polymerase sigma-70 factor (ECF subfamily)